MAFDNSQLARISLLAMSYAVSQGVDLEYLLDVAGLSPEVLANPDSRISTASMVKLWHAIDDSLKDAELGLNIGRTVGAVQLGMVGYAMYHSRDVRSALQRFAHYMRILSEAVVFTIDETGGDPTASRIDHFRVRSVEFQSDGFDLAGDDQHVGGFISVGCRVQYPSSANQ